jgi:ketosteroid isomerase-like protein
MGWHPSGARRLAAAMACALTLSGAATLAQRGPAAPEPLPPALETMADTERAFAKRAMEVGWKNAFLEYFSDSAIGYNGEEVGNAKQQLLATPDPPPNQQLLWEPRYGDVARSGELGFLTGPSRNILPSRNNGQPRHGVYASIWKRERDGTFRVVVDIGIATPRAAAFPATLTRAPAGNRFAGDLNDRTPPLGTAVSVLNSDLRTGAVRAFRGRLAPGVRFHRPSTMPAVGEAAVLRLLAAQPRYDQVDSRFAESAQSGDLGYTWGTWNRRLPPARGARGAGARQRYETGFYTRVWVRDRSGQWKVLLDVLN